MASSISESSAPTTGRRALALFTVLTAQLMISMELLIVAGLLTVPNGSSEARAHTDRE